MKQNILYLLGILNIFHAAFPMNFKWDKDIKPDYDKAQNFQKNGNLQEALKLYDKVMNSFLPEERPDHYTQARALQTQAIDQILQIAQTLETGDLREALAWYIKVTNKYFSFPLSNQPDLYAKALKLQEQAIIKISQIAQNFEKDNLNEALKLYVKIREKYFPSPLGQPDPYQKAHKIQEHATSKILQNAQTFEQNKKLDDVLKWYSNIINTYIPSPEEGHPDPHKEMRKLQVQAFTRIFQNAQALEQNGNLEEALKWYSNTVNKHIHSSDLQEMQKLQAEAILKISQRAQTLEQTNLMKALEWYGKIADTELPSPDRDRPDPYQEVRKLPEQAINKISEEALQLKKEKKYEESLKIYQFAPNEFKEVITKLQGTIKALPDLQDAEQLAKNPSEENFKKALNLLSKHKMVPEAKMLEMKIQQQERLWKQQQPQQTEVPVAPPKVERKWLFIKNVPGTQDQEDPDADWRVKEQKLELNLNAKDPITFNSFADLIEKAQDDHLPFILVMAESRGATDPKKYTHFFDGTVINNFMAGWKRTVEKETSQYIEDPLNRQKVINIEIYAMDKEGKLYLLKANADANYLEKFVNDKGTILVGITPFHNYELKPALTTPGTAQTFIANLYKEQADKGGLEAEKFRHLEYIWRDLAQKAFQSTMTETEKQLIQALHSFKKSLGQLIFTLK